MKNIQVFISSAKHWLRHLLHILYSELSASQQNAVRPEVTTVDEDLLIWRFMHMDSEQAADVIKNS